MENNSKEIRYAFLPSFNISEFFSNGTIGVFMGMFVGIIINLLVLNVWLCKNIMLLISVIIAVIFLGVANYQNKKFKELCNSIVINDKENKFKTVSSVLNELWSQKDESDKPRYRKYKRRFNFFLYTSFAIVLISCLVYMNHGNYYKRLKGTVNLKQVESINITFKF